MRYFIHIVTDQERVVDPDGAEYLDLGSARVEACQCARDLMAEELRSGRPVPFGWCVQVAAEDGTVHFTHSFAHLVFAGNMADAVTNASRRMSPAHDLMLVERARATFTRARQSHAEIRTGLAELRGHMRQLERLKGGFGTESA